MYLNFFITLIALAKHLHGYHVPSPARYSTRFQGPITRLSPDAPHPQPYTYIHKLYGATDVATCCDHAFSSIPHEQYGGEAINGACIPGLNEFYVYCRKFTSFNGPNRPYVNYGLTCSCPGNSVCRQPADPKIPQAHCEETKQQLYMDNMELKSTKTYAESQGSVEAALVTRKNVDSLLTDHNVDVWVLATCIQTTVDKDEWFTGAGYVPGRLNNVMTLGIKDTHHPDQLYSSFTTNERNWGSWKLRRVDWNPATMVCVVTGGYAANIVMKIHYFSVQKGSLFSEPDVALHVRRNFEGMVPGSQVSNLTTEILASEGDHFHGSLW